MKPLENKGLHEAQQQVKPGKSFSQFWFPITYLKGIELPNYPKTVIQFVSLWGSLAHSGHKDQEISSLLKEGILPSHVSQPTTKARSETGKKTL